MSEDKDNSSEQRGGGGGRPGGDRPRKFNRYRRKFCRFCANPEMAIDYKQTEVLGRFVTSRGKILPRRVTGTCAKHQRRLAAAVRRARVLNLMPFKVN